MIDLNWQGKLWRSLLTSIMAIGLIWGAFGCSDRTSVPTIPTISKSIPTKVQPNISEASPPAIIQKLRQQLENYQPQVKILSPQPDEILPDNTITVRFQVQDLPIFKNADLELGPHLQVFLDNQPYQKVYDASGPLVLEDLPAGTHTLRVLASSPWYESFKNDGAYAQTTFHIFTKTDQNNPNPTQPLLTYNQPQGSYGAEPIMLDFYLSNLPSDPLAAENPDLAQVQIRCTINGESFTLNQWQPIYLKGFKPGKNWVELELIDEQGNQIKNIFNNTIHVINYNKEAKDTLSQLVLGELSADDARGIVDPDYVATQPAPTEIPIQDATPTATPTPSETSPEVAAPTPTPSETSSEAAAPTATPATAADDTLTPTATPSPVAVPSIAPTVEETPAVQPPQVESTKASDKQPTASQPLEKTTGGFYSRFRRKDFQEATTSTETVSTEAKQVEKPKFGGFFHRFRRPPVVEPTPSPSLPSTIPPVIVTPSPEPVTPEAAVKLPEVLLEVNTFSSSQPSLEETTAVEEKEVAEEITQTNSSQLSLEETTAVEEKEVTEEITQTNSSQLSLEETTNNSPVKIEEKTEPSSEASPELDLKLPSDSPEASETPSSETTGVLTET